MSINNLQMQYALRTQLLTIQPAATGSTSLAATANGFVRTTGSFVTDGFEPGMELLAAGFSTGSNNVSWTIDTVDATTLYVSGLTAEVAGTGRTLTVGLPSGRAWENFNFTPTAGKPWFEESYLAGPSSQITGGSTAATLDVSPIYVARIYVPENSGVSAANRYADAVLSVFSSNTSMTLTNADTLRVRLNPGPYRGQLIRDRAGWVVVPVTVPCRLLTLNS